MTKAFFAFRRQILLCYLVCFCSAINASHFEIPPAQTGVLVCTLPVGYSTTVNNITTSGAKLNLNNVSGFVAYEWRYREIYTSAWSTQSTTTNTITLAGLPSPVTFEWQFRVKCSDGTWTAWTNGAGFRTNENPLCVAPKNLAVSNITQNTVTFNWNVVPGALSYNILFLNNGTWSTLSTGITSNLWSIYGLNAGSNYQWKVEAICASNIKSTSTIATFQTAAGINCTSGTAKSTTAITPGISWGYQSGLAGGQYSIFNVTKGVTYTFSCCTQDGGAQGFDSQLSIRNDVNNGLIAFSEDACGTAPKIVWQAGFTGKIRVLVTKKSCLTDTRTCTLAYRVGTTECVAPSGLMAKNITQNTVTLSWNAASGAKSYIVQFYNGAWKDYYLTGTELNFYGLSPNNTYYYRVFTVCSDDKLIASSILSFATPTVTGCTGGSQYPSTALTPVAQWKSQQGVSAFTMCAQEGGYVAGFDAQLSLLSTANTLLAFSEDATGCATAPKITWQSNFNGQVRLLMTKKTCQLQASNNTIVYGTGTYSSTPLQSNDAETGKAISAYTNISASQWADGLPIEVPTDQAQSILFTDQGIKSHLSYANHIIIAPNPVNGGSDFTISLTDPSLTIRDIEVFNNYGTSMGTGRTALSTDQIVVLTDNWPVGMYFVRVNTNRGITTKKILVIK
jgi:Secretion system C-terminal sorting domain